MARYNDLREWLELVDGMGQLARLDGADWDLEIGAITDMVSKSHELKPALLFDNIVGHAPGYRVLSSSLNSMERLALTCGIDSGVKDLEFLRMWTRYVKGLSPIPPRVVGRGPVLDNVFTGDQVNLLKFPSPRWHDLDGGRYIGTATVVITRDPDNGELNTGCYRTMVYDERHLGMLISAQHGGNYHRRKWFARGEPCPVVVSFGHDPLLFVAAATPLPAGRNELEWAGGIRGEPFEVIEGELTGLPIPASSELAIEGYFLPDDSRPEGPFGEFTGYYASGERPEPALRVDRLLHRDDPIILAAPRGRPPDDPTYWQTRFKASAIWEGLDGAGVPDVQGVWCHHPNSNFFTVVAIKQRYAGPARQAGLVAQNCAGGVGFGRWVVVVDEDIDPSNIDDVLWALSTRADPERAIEITRFNMNNSLDTARAPEDRIHSSRCIIEACRPWEWRDRFPVVAETKRELADAVRRKWSDQIWRVPVAAR
jgi:4-hydroxy-3-polyprenylbenzoate decarboxylase